MLDVCREIIDDTTHRALLVKQDVNFDREYQNDETRERDSFLGSLILDHKFNDRILVNAYYNSTNDKANLDTGAWFNNNDKVVSNKKKANDFS